jgi:thiamine biosynthesis protein ThiI
LIGIDKLEIEAMAKRIGTYEMSISGSSGPTCTILPEHVITMAEVDNVLDEESKVDMAEMINYALSNLKGLTDLDRENS